MNVGLVFAGVGALGGGAYLFAIKRYFDDYPATVFVVLANGVALVWYAPVAALTVRGPLVPAGDPPSLAVLVGVAAGTALALWALIRAVTTGEVSHVAPISKVVPAFVLPIEILLLDQHLSDVQVGGVVLSTLAIYLANYEPGTPFTPLERAVSARPARLALLSAATFGFVDVGKRVVMQELSLPPQTLVLATLSGVTLVLAPLAIRRWPDGGLGADRRKFVAVGGAVAVINHVVALSFETLPASVASPIVNTQAVVAVLLGGVVLAEPQFRVRLVAATVAVVGVTLIALG